VPKEKEAEYHRAAELAVSAARGSLPHGAELLSPSATGSGGAGVFAERLKYIDEQIVVAGTSGKLTVLAESGAGTLAGSAQKDAFDEIAQAIADQISGVMQKQFDLLVLERLHAGEPVLAYFEFAAVNEKDVTGHADNAVKFGEAGYTIDDAELSEKSGYRLRYVGPQAAHTNRPDGTKPIGVPGAEDTGAAASSAAEGLASASPGRAEARPSAVAAVADQLQLTEAFVRPAKGVIDELLAKAQSGVVSDDELLASAEELLKRIPELAASTDVSEVADALTSAMQAAAEATLVGRVYNLPD
jgi:phage gp29-like protein